jgi:hypothetical protein
MKCAACGKELERAFIREERGSEVLRFCSVTCFREVLGNRIRT